MKVLSAKSRGLIGLKEGMGVDEISLDLSQLSGMIALAGENGRGKSTFMETLQPHPIMPSRKSVDGSKYALQRNFYLRDSYLDREYLFNGDRIRCLVKINGGSNYSPEGFIWINDQPKVDGKISSYSGLATEIFGSQELLFNSAFCAQGSKQLNNLDPADLKNLFAEMIQLHKYIKWEDVSKGCGKILNGKLSAVEKSIMVLNSKITEFAISGTAEIEIEKGLKEQAEKAVIRLTDMITAQEGKIEEEKKKLIENDKLVSRKNDIQKSLDQVKKDIETESQQSLKELGTAKEKAQTIFSQFKQHEETLKDKEAIERAVSGIETLTNELTAHREDLEKGNETVRQFNENLDTQEKQIRKIKDKANNSESLILTTINELSKVRGEHQLDIEKAKTTYSTAALEAELLSLRNQTKILETRKQDQACPDIMAKCMFVNAAYKALDMIPDIKSHIDSNKWGFEKIHDKAIHLIQEIDIWISEKKEAIKTLKETADKDIKAITEQVIAQEVDRDKAADGVKALKDQISKIERRISELKPIAAKADLIKVAESQIESLKKQKEAITQEGLELKTKWDNRINKLQLRKSEMIGLILDMVKIIDSDVESRIQAMERELSGLKATLETVKKSISQAETKIKDLEREAQEIEKLNKDLEAANAEKKTITGQMGLWLYCQHGCGKDGLRALEIDSVVPNIVHETNDLLSSSNFGTIKIITQDPDTGKEIFKIIVINDSGKEVPLDLRSGGEKIWPVQALRLGMTLIYKRKSNKIYKTVFNDELDGSMDPKNAKRFISLYPRFMKTGGFDTCFYISHKKECVDMADHSLVFADGGITVE